MILADAASLPTEPAPVIVIGAGPAGLVQALELRRHGLDVAVLVGGVDRLDPRYQELADAEIVSTGRQAPMRLAVGRALGGTSLLWGGRCVPFDDVDFRPRPLVPNGGWPLQHSAIRPWYEVAARYLDAEMPAFAAAAEGLPNTPDCCFDQLEHWSDARDLSRFHRLALSRDERLRIHLGVVAVGLEIDPVTGRVEGVIAALPSGERRVLRARAVVLACGGLETTRLLLVAQSERPRLFGGAAGALGRYYMGHAGGQIADIVLNPSVPAGAFSFFVGQGGRYVRRRITIAETAQVKHGLLNLAAFPINPPLADPAHRSAILSLAYLSLATPGLGPALAPEVIRRKHLEAGVRQVPRHLRNIIRGLPAAMHGATRFLHGRYLTRPRLPGFEISNRAGRYTLYYHAEQAPNPVSTVHLGGGCDRLGMPQLQVDLRFSQADARSIVDSHAVINRNLRQAGLGRLEYNVPQGERMAAALDQASDGYHQIGTTRMSADPANGVVDSDCRVHGTPNLFIASSSTFPTSGQANPTLLVAALSARLADHIARGIGRLPSMSAPRRLVAQL